MATNCKEKNWKGEVEQGTEQRRKRVEIELSGRAREGQEGEVIRHGNA